MSTEAGRGNDLVTPPDFDQLYRHDVDPWRVGSSFYEQRKQALVLASLSQPDYVEVWDPACGTGHLVAQLAGRAKRVRASDASAPAIEIARRTCRGLANVQLDVAVLPGPVAERAVDDRRFDLMVIGEFLYYLEEPARSATLNRLDRYAAAQAEIVSVHWRRRPHDGWLSGEDVQREIVAHLTTRGWTATVHLDDPGFVLDTLRLDR